MESRSFLLRFLLGITYFSVFAFVYLLGFPAKAKADVCALCHLVYVGGKYDFECWDDGEYPLGGDYCEVKYDKKGNVKWCQEVGNCDPPPP